MRYKDTWKRRIPSEKLAAYKQMLINENISAPSVVYHLGTGVTEVEYDSDLPRELITNLLKKIAEEVIKSEAE